MYIYSNIDLLPYILIYVVLLFLSFVKNNKYTLIIAVSFLVLFSGLRYGIGYDYMQYLSKVTGNTDSGYEWLANFIVLISRYFRMPQLFFFINSCVFIFPIAYVCNKLTNKATLCLFCMFLIPYLYIDGMSIIRNASAYSLIFLSSYFFIKKKYVNCFVTCVLATGFHSSAFISLLIFLCITQYKRSNGMLNILILAAALVFMFFNISEVIYLILKSYLPSNLFDNASYYFIKNTEQGRFTKVVLFGIGVCNTVLYNKLVTINNMNRAYILLFNIGLLIWGILSFDHTLSLRLSTYFLIFLILICSSYASLRLFHGLIKVKYILICFLTIYLSSSFFVNINAYRNGQLDKISFLPYQTIFMYENFFNF